MHALFIIFHFSDVLLNIITFHSFRDIFPSSLFMHSFFIIYSNKIKVQRDEESNAMLLCPLVVVVHLFHVRLIHYINKWMKEYNWTKKERKKKRKTREHYLKGVMMLREVELNELKDYRITVRQWTLQWMKGKVSFVFHSHLIAIFVTI